MARDTRLPRASGALSPAAGGQSTVCLRASSLVSACVVELRVSLLVLSPERRGEGFFYCRELYNAEIREREDSKVFFCVCREKSFCGCRLTVVYRDIIMT